jgi:hypothetical protein
MEAEMPPDESTEMRVAVAVLNTQYSHIKDTLALQSADIRRMAEAIESIANMDHRMSLLERDVADIKKNQDRYYAQARTRDADKRKDFRAIAVEVAKYATLLVVGVILSKLHIPIPQIG